MKYMKIPLGIIADNAVWKLSAGYVLHLMTQFASLGTHISPDNNKEVWLKTY